MCPPVSVIVDIMRFEFCRCKWLRFYISEAAFRECVAPYCVFKTTEEMRFKEKACKQSAERGKCKYCH